MPVSMCAASMPAIFRSRAYAVFYRDLRLAKCNRDIDQQVCVIRKDRLPADPFLLLGWLSVRLVGGDITRIAGCGQARFGFGNGGVLDVPGRPASQHNLVVDTAVKRRCPFIYPFGNLKNVVAGRACQRIPLIKFHRSGRDRIEFLVGVSYRPAVGQVDRELERGDVVNLCICFGTSALIGREPNGVPYVTGRGCPLRNIHFIWLARRKDKRITARFKLKVTSVRGCKIDLRNPADALKRGGHAVEDAVNQVLRVKDMELVLLWVGRPGKQRAFRCERDRQSVSLGNRWPRKGEVPAGQLGELLHHFFRAGPLFTGEWFEIGRAPCQQRARRGLRGRGCVRLGCVRHRRYSGRVLRLILGGGCTAGECRQYRKHCGNRFKVLHN